VERASAVESAGPTPGRPPGSQLPALDDAGPGAPGGAFGADSFVKGLVHRFLPDPMYYGWAVAGLGLMAAALSAPGQSFALSF
jgi:hypothetical protein